MRILLPESSRKWKPSKEAPPDPSTHAHTRLHMDPPIRASFGSPVPPWGQPFTCALDPIASCLPKAACRSALLPSLSCTIHTYSASFPSAHKCVLISLVGENKKHLSHSIVKQLYSNKDLLKKKTTLVSISLPYQLSPHFSPSLYRKGREGLILPSPFLSSCSHSIASPSGLSTLDKTAVISSGNSGSSSF